MTHKILAVLGMLKGIFWRKHIREINFVSGSTTWRECLIIISSLFTGRDIVNGKHIKQYEENFSLYLGVRYAFSFGAGRMAFYAMLKAMGIKEGDEVILPGYTCVVVPDAIIYCGAKPVYVDIDSNTLNIDVSKIEEKITPRTKVLYAQHTFGSFCNMGAIMKIARKYNLKVVEDCAHAVGAEYDGKKAGAFGDAAYFTTEQSKIISTGMGGMAITNDKEIAARIREIQAKSGFYDEKIIKKIALQIVLYNILYHPLIHFIGKYGLNVLSNKLNFFIQSTTEEEMEGKRPKKYPVRLSNIQAKVGLSQLRSINQNLEHRRKIAMFYKESFKKLNCKIPENNDRLYNPAYIRYWVIVDDRDKLKKVFQSKGVELGEWFNCPIHPRATSLKNVFYEIGSCSIAEYMTEHNINLPTHLKVSIKQAGKIIKILEDYAAESIIN